MNLSVAKAIDRRVGVAVCWALSALRTLREWIAPRSELVDPQTIVLLKFWGLGNVVLLLPVVRALRHRFPDARIVFVSLARNRELLEECDEIDERLYVRDRSAFALATSLLRVVLAARRARPDLCIDFEQFARASVIVAELAGAKQIIGLDTPGHRCRSLLHHKSVRYDDGQHMGQTYLDLARAAGVPERTYRPSAPRVTLAARAESEALLAGHRDHVGPLVVVHPGSGDNFAGRRWPAASFAQLVRRLVDHEDALVVVTGTTTEASLTARIAADAARAEHVIDASGRLSVSGLVALLSRSTLLVSNDTAPVHVASSLGVPVFAFFGPNTPRLYGPLSPGSHSFYRALPCSPCLTNMNYKTSSCRMPVCVRDISVEEVVLRVRAHLMDRRGRGRSSAARTA